RECEEAAPALMRLLVDGFSATAAAPGAGIAELLSVGQPNREELTAGFPILQRPDHYLDVHAGNKRLRNPALSRQTAGRAEFDRPFHKVTFCIGNVQKNPTVGI